MTSDETSTLIHPDEPPEFEFEKGAAFKLSQEADPEEYYYILARMWNYDADHEDYGPIGWYFKQYQVGEVSSLGGNPRLIAEKDLLEHYERVTKEEAQELILDG